MIKRKCLKTVTTIIVASVAANAYATDPGFYMGLMLGPATNNGGTLQVQTTGAPGLPKTTPAKPKSKQFGSRLFMGYQMSKYVGVEGGLDYFTGIQYDTNNVPTCSGPQVRNRGFDLVGKGIMPFYNFSLFGKLGAALIYQSSSGSVNSDTSAACGKSQYITKVRPTASIGASYDLTQNWVADVSMNRLMAGGPSGSVDYYAFGISYHFVNQYCGQFLCDS